MMATSMLQMLNFVPRITTVIGPEPSDNGLIAADVRASRPGLRCPFGIEVGESLSANELRAYFPSRPRPASRSDRPDKYQRLLPQQLSAPVMPDGRGRDEDFSSPPAQIPACAANGPGSSLGFQRRSGDKAAVV